MPPLLGSSTVMKIVLRHRRSAEQVRVGAARLIVSRSCSSTRRIALATPLNDDIAGGGDPAHSQSERYRHPPLQNCRQFRVRRDGNLIGASAV